MEVTAQCARKCSQCMARALHPQGTTHKIFKDFELLVIPSLENLGGALKWTPSVSLLPYSPLSPLPGSSEVYLPPGTKAG